MNLLSARDKKLAYLKETLKTYEQVYYNKGFKDVEKSAGPVIFQAFGFSKGWMAKVNAISLPNTFLFIEL